MSEKRFEEDEVGSYDNEYNYSLLDTYYEFKSDRIIEWNKHSDNVEYFDLESLIDILNLKEMRLESCQKGGKEEYERRVKLIQECNKLAEENKQLQNTVRRQDITIQTLTLNLEKVVKETEIVQMLQNEQKKVEMLEEENEQLKNELDNFKNDTDRLYHYYTLALSKKRG